MKIRKVLSDARRKRWVAERLTLKEVDEQKRIDEALNGFGQGLKEKIDEALKEFAKGLKEKTDEMLGKILELAKGDQGKRPLTEAAKPEDKTLAEVVPKEQPSELVRPEAKPLVEVVQQPYSPLPGFGKVNPIQRVAEVGPNPLVGLVRSQHKPLSEVAKEPAQPELVRPALKALEEVAREEPPPELVRHDRRPLGEIAKEPPGGELVRTEPQPYRFRPELEELNLARPQHKPLFEVAKEEAQPGLGRPQPRALMEFAKEEGQLGFDKASPIRIMDVRAPQIETMKAGDLLKIKEGRTDEGGIRAEDIAKGEEKDGKADYLEREIAKINVGLEGVRRELKERNVKKPEQVEAMEKSQEKISYLDGDDGDEIRNAVKEGFRDW